MSIVSTVRSRRSSIVSQQSKALSKAGPSSSSKFGLSTASRAGGPQHARGRRGSQAQSVRTAAGLVGLAEDEQHAAASRSTETIHFVYSVAVVRALRHDYKLAALGPPSAPPSEPPVEISRLPELYADFRLVSDLLRSNQRYAEALRRQQLEASGPDSAAGRPGSRGRLPSIPSRKSSLKSSSSRRRRRSRHVALTAREDGVTKLPPIT